MEVNSKTGKNISLVFNDKDAGIAGSTAANVGLDVDSSGNFIINTSGTSTTINSLINSPNGISAAGGITFNSPIISTRLPRLTSTSFDTKTADFTPTEADNGKVFVINISGKTQVTVTLEGLSVGWRAKFLVLGGSGVFFDSTTGTVYGKFGLDGSGGGAVDECVEVHCYGTNLYHAS
jgi:hypothetical protein